MLFIFDLDGVIYTGQTVLPHAAETVARLQAAGHAVYYLTNNSAQTRRGYRAKLAGMGIDAPEERIMTSAYATALRLKEEGARGASALVIGQGGLYEELGAVGLRFVEPSPDARADYVIVGIDRQFTYEKLKAAQQAILHGAHFIATNRDPIYPLEGGRVEPGSGSIVISVETASLTVPEVIGKPSPEAAEIILKEAGYPPDQAVMVGDRADTDIACGRAAGMHTVLVLTGTTRREEAEQLPEELKPEWILEDLSGLEAAFQQGK
ncbi:MAG: HAD-IIA family hydrolase [Armatimonadetes bacterium]|nr:HAD-IIA family hydrolase [Armatimonadota bacterium]